MSECQSGGNITRKRSNKRKLLRIWEGRVWKGWAAQLRKKIDEVAAEGDNTDDGISPKKKSSHTNLVTMMEASIEMKKKKNMSRSSDKFITESWTWELQSCSNNSSSQCYFRNSISINNSKKPWIWLCWTHKRAAQAYQEPLKINDNLRASDIAWKLRFCTRILLQGALKCGHF